MTGEPTLGTFLNLGSPVAAEICASAGYDWVLIDLEHGSGTAADLLQHLQAVSGTGATAFVRVELTGRTHVSRALDAGAGGIMLPRIESAVEAQQAASYLRFPPTGVRGVATQNRSGQYGAVPMADLGKREHTTVGIVQIETLGALSELREIAKIDGVDVLFVGPGDLSYALGVPGLTRDPRYLEALRAVVDAADDAGVSPGILVPDMAAAQSHLELGFTFIAVGSDSGNVRLAAANAVAGFRAAVESLRPKVGSNDGRQAE